MAWPGKSIYVEGAYLKGGQPCAALQGESRLCLLCMPAHNPPQVMRHTNLHGTMRSITGTNCMPSRYRSMLLSLLQGHLAVLDKSFLYTVRAVHKRSLHKQITILP